MALWDPKTARWCFSNFARVAKEMGHAGFAADIRRAARRPKVVRSRESAERALEELYGAEAIPPLMARLDREMSEAEARRSFVGPRGAIERMIDRATGFDRTPGYPK